jgi:hypothetical protein
MVLVWPAARRWPSSLMSGRRRKPCTRHVPLAVTKRPGACMERVAGMQPVVLRGFAAVCNVYPPRPSTMACAERAAAGVACSAVVVEGSRPAGPDPRRLDLDPEPDLRRVRQVYAPPRTAREERRAPLDRVFPSRIRHATAHPAMCRYCFAPRIKVFCFGLHVQQPSTTTSTLCLRRTRSPTARGRLWAVSCPSTNPTDSVVCGVGNQPAYTVIVIAGLSTAKRVESLNPNPKSAGRGLVPLTFGR